jgi:[ribosomal protein S5]-alanine N-acetyltransferase
VIQIELDTFRIRSFRPEDAESIARHANNPKIAAQVRDRFPYPYKLEDAHEFLSNLKHDPETCFAIAERVNDEAVGGIMLFPGTDIERVSAEVGYWLGEPYWGKGIATRAVVALTEYGLKNFEFTRLFATPFASNVASCRVLEKAGYVRDAILRRAVIKYGVVHDLALYSRTRE